MNPIDPVCVFHGKRASEHVCLYCCLCFKSLTPEECHVRSDGEREDVCDECAKLETLAQQAVAYMSSVYDDCAKAEKK